MILRTALRSLRRSPGFAVVALLSLAIGLGANTALFSLLNGVMLRPLPYAEPERLVDVSEDNPAELCAGCAVGTSFPAFREWRAAARSFERLDAYLETGFALAGAADPSRVSGALVSAGLMETLGRRPLHGRLLVPGDDAPGAPRVALLSHRLWVRELGADPAAIGRTIRLNGEPHTIVGVMPPRFGFPEFAQLWVPIGDRLGDQARDDRSVGVVGRLARGVTLAQANAEMAALAAAAAAAEPAIGAGWTARVAPLERPLADAGVNTGFLMAVAASGFVLLIACANLANLMLARGASRTRETAVRLALGAGRGAVIRHLLAESVLLSAAGGLAGLVVALWLLRAVVAAIDAEIPAWIDFSFDGRVFAFAALVATGTGLLFGLLPGLRAGRTDVQQALRSGALTATAGPREGRLRDLLAVAQVTLALVLLIGTAILVRSFGAWRSLDPGSDPERVLLGTVALGEARYASPEAVYRFGADLVERLEAAPGVVAASVEHQEFLGTFVGTASRVTLEGAAAPVPDAVAPRFRLAVTPAFFAIRGIALEEGRLLDGRDGPGAEPAALVTRTTADRLWPGRSPLGMRFRIGEGDAARWLTVVGVVRVPPTRPGGQPGAFVYTAFAQQAARPLTVALRTEGPAAGHAALLRAAVRDLDPDQPVDAVMTMARFRSVSIAPLRFMLAVMSSLGLVALVLAALGLYGVLAYLVARRTRELGIRMALGAATGDLLALVVRRGMTLAAVGVGLGVPAALALSGLLRRALFGLVAVDPLAFAGAAAGLLAVALVACWLPARRATRVDPVEALRAD